VEVHPGHRAVLPDGFACDEITSEPVWAARLLRHNGRYSATV